MAWREARGGSRERCEGRSGVAVAHGARRCCSSLPLAFAREGTAHAALRFRPLPSPPLAFAREARVARASLRFRPPPGRGSRARRPPPSAPPSSLPRPSRAWVLAGVAVRAHLSSSRCLVAVRAPQAAYSTLTLTSYPRAPQAAYNTLTLFVVSESTWHFVSPVWPQGDGAGGRKRLAVSGWFLGTDADDLAAHGARDAPGGADYERSAALVRHYERATREGLDDARRERHRRPLNEL